MNWEYAFEKWLKAKGNEPIYRGIPWDKLGDMTRAMVRTGFREGYQEAARIYQQRERGTR